MSNETSHKVLAADDSALYRAKVEDVLAGAGYEVVMAEDGQEAVEKAGSEKPDLIILDVMMPRMDGFAALMKLRGDEGTRKIPIIMLTTKTEQVYKDIGSGFGASVYMEKPFDEQELLDNVSRLLAERDS